MQTHFSLTQLADPAIAEADSILRKCVHCGFCTATCPTFVLLGDERDSPRGRIYMIKDMLENERPADKETRTHLDRCLSCLSCMTTCPSGVDYRHLLDHARAHIENTARRPLPERLMRAILAHVLPYRGRFRLALRLARIGRMFEPLLKRVEALSSLAAMLELAPARLPPAPEAAPRPARARARVIVMRGCAQDVLAPQINAAACELLAGLDIEVVDVPGEGCCGALVHHMGRHAQSARAVRHNIDLWTRAIEEHAVEAILMTASGCGTTVADYGHMLRHDAQYSARAARISAMTYDISAYLAPRQFTSVGSAPPLRVAYHGACSLQHGQGISEAPRELLRRAGFSLSDVAMGHLCCGSAGVYNIFQPEIATRLRDDKLEHLQADAPDVIATGNIGCMTHLQARAGVPVVHTVELLNWAAGGKRPATVAPRGQD